MTHRNRQFRPPHSSWYPLDIILIFVFVPPMVALVVRDIILPALGFVILGVP